MLRVTPRGAAEARAWRWHQTHVVEDRPAGGGEVWFLASRMRELCRHLFSRGEPVETAAPKRLKDMMAEALAAVGRALKRSQA